MKTTLFLISTLLLALSPPTLSNHNGGENTRFGRQDQSDFESVVVDVDDEKSVLEMAGVRFWLLLFTFFTNEMFLSQDMLQLGVRPVLGYVLNALIVVSLFLLAINILQITLFPLVSAVRMIYIAIIKQYNLLVKMSSSRGFRPRAGPCETTSLPASMHSLDSDFLLI